MGDLESNGPLHLQVGYVTICYDMRTRLCELECGSGSSLCRRWAGRLGDPLGHPFAMAFFACGSQCQTLSRASREKHWWSNSMLQTSVAPQVLLHSITVVEKIVGCCDKWAKGTSNFSGRVGFRALSEEMNKIHTPMFLLMWISNGISDQAKVWVWAHRNIVPFNVDFERHFGSG